MIYRFTNTRALADHLRRLPEMPIQVEGLGDVDGVVSDDGVFIFVEDGDAYWKAIADAKRKAAEALKKGKRKKAA